MSADKTAEFGENRKWVAASVTSRCVRKQKQSHDHAVAAAAPAADGWRGAAVAVAKTASAISNQNRKWRWWRHNTAVSRRRWRHRRSFRSRKLVTGRGRVVHPRCSGRRGTRSQKAAATKAMPPPRALGPTRGRAGCPHRHLTFACIRSTLPKPLRLEPTSSGSRDLLRWRHRPLAQPHTTPVFDVARIM